MKKFLLRFTLILGLLSIFGVSQSFFNTSDVVYANTADAVLKPFVLLDTTHGAEEVVRTVNKVSEKTSEKFNLLSYKEAAGGKAKIEIDKARYLKLSTGEQRRLMEAVMTTINNSEIGSRDKNRFLNFIENQDSAMIKQLRFLSSNTSVDLENSQMFLMFFNSIWGVIMGVLLLASMLLLVTSVAVDTLYIAIPFFYSLVHAKTESRVWFISFEAYSVMREEVGLMESSRSSNYFLKYMKRRSLIFFFVGIVFTMMVSNSLWRFLDLIFEVVNSLIKGIVGG